MPNWLKGGIFMLLTTTVAFLFGLILLVISTYISPWIAIIILPVIGVFLIGALVGTIANGVPSKRFSDMMDRIWKSQ